MLGNGRYKVKLLFCPICQDVFKLSEELRTCACGRVRGKYLNDRDAVTNGKGIDIAIGNGSLLTAIEGMRSIEHPEKMDRGMWIDTGRIEYAWVRPSEGIGNPHTEVDPNL